MQTMTITRPVEIRFSLGVPLEDIFPEGDVHPSIRKLLVETFNALRVSPVPIKYILRYDAPYPECLSLENALVRCDQIDLMNPGTLLWMLRHFLGSLPLPVLPKYTNGESFTWLKISDRCKFALERYVKDRRTNECIIDVLSDELLRLPSVNLLLIGYLINFLRSLVVYPGRELKFNKSSVLALANYYSPAIFVRPYYKKQKPKTEQLYRPLMLYFLIKWPEIQRQCIEKRPQCFVPMEKRVPREFSVFKKRKFAAQKRSSYTQTSEDLQMREKDAFVFQNDSLVLNLTQAANETPVSGKLQVELEDESNKLIDENLISTKIIFQPKNESLSSTKLIDRSKEETLYSTKLIDESKEGSLFSTKLLDESKEQILYPNKLIGESKEGSLFSTKLIDESKEETFYTTKLIDESKEASPVSTKLVEESRNDFQVTPKKIFNQSQIFRKSTYTKRRINSEAGNEFPVSVRAENDSVLNKPREYLRNMNCIREEVLSTISSDDSFVSLSETDFLKDTGCQTDFSRKASSTQTRLIGLTSGNITMDYPYQFLDQDLLEGKYFRYADYNIDYPRNRVNIDYAKKQVSYCAKDDYQLPNYVDGVETKYSDFAKVDFSKNDVLNCAKVDYGIPNRVGSVETKYSNFAKVDLTKNDVSSCAKVDYGILNRVDVVEAKYSNFAKAHLAKNDFSNCAKVIFPKNTISDCAKVDFPENAVSDCAKVDGVKTKKSGYARRKHCDCAEINIPDCAKDEISNYANLVCSKNALFAGAGNYAMINNDYPEMRISDSNSELISSNDHKMINNDYPEMRILDSVTNSELISSNDHKEDLIVRSSQIGWTYTPEMTERLPQQLSYTNKINDVDLKSVSNSGENIEKLSKLLKAKISSHNSENVHTKQMTDNLINFENRGVSFNNKNSMKTMDDNLINFENPGVLKNNSIKTLEHRSDFHSYSDVERSTTDLINNADFENTINVTNKEFREINNLETPLQHSKSKWSLGKFKNKLDFLKMFKDRRVLSAASAEQIRSKIKYEKIDGAKSTTF